MNILVTGGAGFIGSNLVHYLLGDASSELGIEIGKVVTLDKLHANIQDTFNESGVQIMSPNYEADPESPKVVPRDKWFEPPAAR